MSVPAPLLLVGEKRIVDVRHSNRLMYSPYNPATAYLPKPIFIAFSIDMVFPIIV
jgi:hypothetical protein